MKSSVQVNDTDTYVALAKAGFGMIQPAIFSVENALSAGELVEVLPRNPVPKKPVSLVYPHREKLAPKLRVFISWVAALFENSSLVDRIQSVNVATMNVSTRNRDAHAC